MRTHIWKEGTGKRPGGMSLTRVAAALGVSRIQMYGLILAAGVEPVEAPASRGVRSGRRRLLFPEQVAAIRALPGMRLTRN